MIRDMSFFRVQWPAACRPGGEFEGDHQGDGGGVRPYGGHMGESE
jgi:hypothetical protein